MPEAERRLVWSPEAEVDLLEIWHWGARFFSPERADAHLRDIASAARNLTAAPFSGRSREDLHADLRSIVVYPTVVFYRVSKQSIDVVRIVDGRRNLAAIFPRGGETI
jgi:toxin ParE1/3/4